jgi:VanZ family protein
MTQPEPFFAPTGSGQSYRTRLLLVAAVAGILVIVLVFPFPQSGRQWSELFNLAHAPSFFLVFLLAAGLFDPTCIGFPQSWHRILPLGPLHLSVLVSVLLVLGVACEVMQGFVGRSPSVSDVLANGCGLVAGLCWCLSRQRMTFSGRFGL